MLTVCAPRLSRELLRANMTKQGMLRYKLRILLLVTFTRLLGSCGAAACVAEISRQLTFAALSDDPLRHLRKRKQTFRIDELHNRVNELRAKTDRHALMPEFGKNGAGRAQPVVRQGSD